MVPVRAVSTGAISGVAERAVQETEMMTRKFFLWLQIGVAAIKKLLIYASSECIHTRTYMPDVPHESGWELKATLKMAGVKITAR